MATILLAASTAMSAAALVGGGIAQAQAQKAEGKAAAQEARSQASIADYNAQVAAQDARSIEAQTRVRQRQQAQAANRYQSSLEASLGASGASMSEGTPLLIQARQAAESELDNLMIGEEGWIAAERARSQGYEASMQASIYRTRATNMIAASRAAAGMSLLSGFANAGSLVASSASKMMSVSSQESKSAPKATPKPAARTK